MSIPDMLRSAGALFTGMPNATRAAPRRQDGAAVADGAGRAAGGRPGAADDAERDLLDRRRQLSVLIANWL